MLRTRELLAALSEAEVAFVIIGGMAAVAQGSSYVTADLDLCYRRDRLNYERICRALAPFGPRLRGAPADLPFSLQPATLRNGMNFTLTTSAGDLDLLGEVTGIGDFQAVLELAEQMELFEYPVQVLSLEGLIRAKEAVGREKDLRLLAELRALRALRSEQDES